MGRAPCCDKANVKKGPWSPEEDSILKSYIEEHGTGGNWIALPHKIGLKRCGKSCRLRWLNYLRPNIRHGGFSEEEDNIICSLYLSIGSRWSMIAAHLPERTDNDIKNYWNTKLKKKFLGSKQCQEQAMSRRSNSKQEAKREPEGMNQQPHNYCPVDLPTASMPIMNLNQQEPQFMDNIQESMKNLMFKLQESSINEPTTSYVFDPSLLSSMNSIDSITTSSTEFPALSNYCGLNETSPKLLQESLDMSIITPVELDELVYGINGSSQQLMEGGLLMDMTSTTTTSESTTNSVKSSTNWGNLNSSSLVNYSYSQFSSDYETSLQSMPQTSFFEDSLMYYEWQ